MKTLGEDGGTEIVDEIRILVVNRIPACNDWQAEASCHGVAFDNLWDRLMAAAEFGDDDSLDALNDLATMHARNVKSPNFQRWGSIFPVLELMIDNWTINYFIAVAIKQTLPSTSSLVQYANTMIGLMNGESGPPGTALTSGQCPPLYFEGLFTRAFGESYFLRHFDWLLMTRRNRTIFGDVEIL